MTPCVPDVCSIMLLYCFDEEVLRAVYFSEPRLACEEAAWLFVEERATGETITWISDGHGVLIQTLPRCGLMAADGGLRIIQGEFKAIARIQG